MSSVNVLADVFTSAECQNILKNKFVLIIGDSVVRGMYKDLVKFLQKDEHLCDNQLKNKGEHIFENDVLLEGGVKGNLSNDITYTEVREFKTPFNYIRFYFITRCYSEYMKSICEDIKAETEKPDLVVMNSGCWDLTRYGMNSIYEYKKNMPEGIYSLIKVLPSYTLFLWTTILPLSKDVKGGFMVPEAECHLSKLREDVLEANKYAVNVIDEFRLDLLDLHFYFLNQIQRRAKDGIHWDATAHRRITNLILNHVCDAWDLETPGRTVMQREVAEVRKEILNTDIDAFDEKLPNDLEAKDNSKKQKLNTEFNSSKPNDFVKESSHERKKISAVRLHDNKAQNNSSSRYSSSRYIVRKDQRRQSPILPSPQTFLPNNNYENSHFSFLKQNSFLNFNSYHNNNLAHLNNNNNNLVSNQTSMMCYAQRTEPISGYTNNTFNNNNFRNDANDFENINNLNNGDINSDNGNGSNLNALIGIIENQLEMDNQQNEVQCQPLMGRNFGNGNGDNANYESNGWNNGNNNYEDKRGTKRKFNY